jgi:CO/xanthine dehydrogenase Mo-binding subunit
MCALRPAASDLSYVGHSVPRLDALAKVTGSAIFPGDIYPPDCLHLKTLTAGRPHARILGLDVYQASTLPGVVAVLTAPDVPNNELGYVHRDKPIICGDVVRFEGDVVALVAAQDEATARRACDLIRVTYQDLPAVGDPRVALHPESPRIHPDFPGNVLRRYKVRKGDVDAGFAEADVIVSGEYSLPMQEHAFLQPEAGIGYMDGDTVVVESGGQCPHDDQGQIAHALGLPPEKVRVVYRSVGGAFGGREDVSVQILLALAAWKLRQTVKIVWSREESVRGHCKRHQMILSTRWGARRDGRLTAAQVDILADAGAYTYSTTMVVPQTVLTCTGVYRIPNVSVDATAVFTNNIPAGAFRGFGSPQGLYAAEMQMGKLAEALGIDPITIREVNLLRQGDDLSVMTPLPAGLDFHPLLARCAEAIGWHRHAGAWHLPPAAGRSHPTQKRGVGLAIGFKNVGFSFGWQDEASASIELHGRAEVDQAILHFAGVDTGQGSGTVIAQMAADALGLPLAKIKVVDQGSTDAKYAGSNSASRLTLVGGNAILGAARAALEKWDAEERPAVGNYTYLAPKTTPFDPESGQCIPNYCWAPIAQAVEVEVDTETGQVSVPRVVTVVDAGKAVNPVQVVGQVEGAVAQGIGYAILENFVSEGGMVRTPNLSTYLIPTVLDVPTEAGTIIMEQPEPVGPFGVRGIGEAPLICIAPAVTAAIRQTTGVWFDRLPLTPPMVLEGLKIKRRGYA